ncbi:alpha/beta hydrolase [uncultured Shewanella sp.]|uniref:alpha/beta hydrolase n=1 Tax=uncultured Shewanella sp. TaxID=173975 RepID=UPI0026328B01|nr:alpha/beta hydrolase [uncultured Shewanella sp.]
MMIAESYIKTEHYDLFALTSIQGRDTLLIFLHGCGDSHLNYADFIHSTQLKSYDIFIPDLIGHGKSSGLSTETFSFELGTQGLIKHIQSLHHSYKRIFIIAHSQGGIYANHLATSDIAQLIKGIYAIETPVTQHGIFISNEVVKCIHQGKNINTWYMDFCHKIYQIGHNEQAMRHYFCGLQFADLSCFIKQCQLTQTLAHAIENQTFTSQIGEDFSKLTIPKLYCLAENGKKQVNLPFLEQHNIPTFIIKNADSHFCAQQQPDIFLAHLNQWLESLLNH